jgi:hypothetical protein
MSGAEHKPGADDEAAEEAKKQEAAAKKDKKTGHEKGHAEAGQKKPVTDHVKDAWKRVGAPVTDWVSSSAKGVVGGGWELTGGTIGNEGRAVGSEFYKAGANVGHAASEGSQRVKNENLAGKIGAGARVGNEVATESLLLIPDAVARYALNTPGRLIHQVTRAVDKVMYGVTGQWKKLKSRGGQQKENPSENKGSGE